MSSLCLFLSHSLSRTPIPSTWIFLVHVCTIRNKLWNWEDNASNKNYHKLGTLTLSLLSVSFSFYLFFMLAIFFPLYLFFYIFLTPSLFRFLFFFLSPSLSISFISISSSSSYLFYLSLFHSIICSFYLFLFLYFFLILSLSLCIYFSFYLHHFSFSSSLSVLCLFYNSLNLGILVGEAASGPHYRYSRERRGLLWSHRLTNTRKEQASQTLEYRGPDRNL